LVPLLLLALSWAGEAGAAVETASADAVSAAFAASDEGIGSEEAAAVVSFALLRSLCDFFGARFEKPAGTSRKIKINRPAPRMISRNMNVNLREQQVQNETLRVLSIGPLRMIPFPGASFFGTAPQAFLNLGQ
jgi:hypothetical protein